jgi:hypothetical protein
LTLLIALSFFAGAARSGEEEDLYGQIMRRYESLNDEVAKALNDYDGTTPLPEFPERVLSLRKNAVVTVGGEVRMGYVASKAHWSDPGLEQVPPGPVNHKSTLTDLNITASKLLIDVRLRERWRLYYDFDMTGHGGRHRSVRLENPNTPGAPATTRYREHFEPQIIQQAYLEFMKDRPSGFGFLAGWMKLPFGLWDRPNTFFQSYLDAPNMNGSYLMGADGWNNAALMPHASRFAEPSLAFMVNYELRDIVRFDAAIFQEHDMEQAYVDRNGVRERRSDSSPPRSWQIGMSVQPLEGWELTAHFRNRYSRSRGVSRWANTPSRWDFRENMATTGNPGWDDSGQWSDEGTGPEFGGRTNEQSVIVGLAVDVPHTNLAVRAEYAHGWNQGFNKYIASDDVNVGLAYTATPRLTLHTQGEWLHVRDRSWMVLDGMGSWRRDRRDNHLYRLMLGAEYELLTGLKLEAGWQYEYWKLRSERGAPNGGEKKTTNTASSFYVGTRFIF